MLDKLGDKVIYYDTDSVVYIDDGTNKIKTGCSLGEWTDELGDDKYMISWISGASKDYGYILNNGEVKGKIKGIKMSYKNENVLNFDERMKVITGFILPNKKIIREFSWLHLELPSAETLQVYESDYILNEQEKNIVYKTTSDITGLKFKRFTDEKHTPIDQTGLHSNSNLQQLVTLNYQFPSYLPYIRHNTRRLFNHVGPYPYVNTASKYAKQWTQNKHLLDKQHFDQRHRIPNFEPGDLVLRKMYHRPNISKLAPHFTRPNEILDIISPNVVKINYPNSPPIE
ncbi:hypothetical protein LAZ67_X002599 [Cordylochernes scorpioides]|uniref:DNA-directed DNA polymerase n=1 Tax=Cordylochernes scorpioides TaxID=51811 RepID=A0ABY6LXL7_9ARAC|nr:hypothetical protein LAZ67_X002599 [Cordylochernes scorpioides]